MEKMIEVVPTLIVPIFASLQKELTEKADRFNTHRTQTEPFKKNCSNMNVTTPAYNTRTVFFYLLCTIYVHNELVENIDAIYL